MKNKPEIDDLYLDLNYNNLDFTKIEISENDIQKNIIINKEDAEFKDFKKTSDLEKIKNKNQNIPGVENNNSPRVDITIDNLEKSNINNNSDVKKGLEFEDIYNLKLEHDKEKFIYYSGIDFNKENVETKHVDNIRFLNTYTSDRKKKLENLNAPWDMRLGKAYQNSQLVGNNMPNTPEMLGSPTIFNENALIRFHHISSSKHHKMILDQVNQIGFRSSGVGRPSAYVSEEQLLRDKEGFVLEKVDGEDYYVVDKNRISQEILNQAQDSQIYADETGAMFIIIENKNIEIWKPDFPDQLPKGFNRTQEVVFADKNLGDTKTKPRPGKYGPPDVGIISEDLIDEYWISNNPYLMNLTTKCPEFPGRIVTTEICNATKEGKNIEKKDIEEIEKEIKKVKDYVIAHKKASWRFVEYEKTKKYLSATNDLIPLNKMELEPTVENLCNIDNWIGNEQFKYDYSDFLYCTYYPQIPNNYLITLRRFPMPVIDSGKIFGQDVSREFMLPIAKAITYIGEATGNTLSNILSFSWQLNWKDMEAQVHEVTGNEMGADALDEIHPSISKIADMLGMLSGDVKFDVASGAAQQNAKFDPYKEGPLANQPMGPVNSITKTKIRNLGIETKHSITLKFSYTARSFGGVNSKAAMLDAFANFLALTYNNAGFWGGAVRYFPNKPYTPFPGGRKAQDAWYSGDIGGFVDAIGDQIARAFENIGNMLMDFLSDPVGAAKRLFTTGAKMYMAKKQRNKRPHLLGFKSLLTGDPIGEWHLMIGNPFNPIAMIGNLIVTNSKVTFSDELGPDDFPLRMDFEITLEHARPRDKGDIESMFNRGGGRLHYAYRGSDDEPWNKSSATRVSKNTVPGSKNVVGKDANLSNQKTQSSFNTPLAANNTSNIENRRSGKFRSSMPRVTNDIYLSKKEAIETFDRTYNSLQRTYGRIANQAKKLAENFGFKHASEVILNKNKK